MVGVVELTTKMKTLIVFITDKFCGKNVTATQITKHLDNLKITDILLRQREDTYTSAFPTQHLVKGKASMLF